MARRYQATKGKRTQGGRRAAPWWRWLVLTAVSLLAITIVLQSRVFGPAAAPAGGPAILAPDFELTLYQGADVLGGEQLNFSDLFTQRKPVVLNFWAGLCPPCRAEMPGFDSVYSELSDQFVLIGIDIGPFVGLGSRDEGRNLLRDLGLTYPAETTFATTVLADYRVRGMPTTVFLTAAGEIIQTQAGLMSEAAFRTAVQDLVAASGAQR